MSNTQLELDFGTGTVDKAVFTSADRGFIGPMDNSPFTYYYKVELGSYGYLDASFEMARLGSASTGIYMDNSISTLAYRAYDKQVEKEIADSVGLVDSTIHALQNYRRDLLEAVEKYKVLREAKIQVEEKLDV